MGFELKEKELKVIEKEELERIEKERSEIREKYLSGGVDKKGRYFVLKQIVESDYYFNPLSKDAKCNFLFGKPKLTDILDKFFKFSKKGKISKGNFKILCTCISELASHLKSKYDAVIFSNIVLEDDNNLNEEDKNNILKFLKFLNLGKKEKLSDLSMKEKNALYSLAGVHKNMRFFFENEVFPLPDAKELFLSYQSGIGITRSLTSLTKEDRIAARGKILSLAEKISEADQCNMFFKLASGVEDVYFCKDDKTDFFKVKKVLGDIEVSESEVVRGSKFSQSSLFGILVVQAFLEYEMNPAESKGMKKLLKDVITNLFNMANKGDADCLEYILSLFYKVNATDLPIRQKTVWDVAKDLFSDDEETIKRLKCLKVLNEVYNCSNISVMNQLFSIVKSKGLENINIDDDDEYENNPQPPLPKSSSSDDGESSKEESSMASPSSSASVSNEESSDSSEESDYTNSDTTLTIKSKYSASSEEEDVSGDKFCPPYPYQESSSSDDGESNKEESSMASPSSSAVVKEGTKKHESASSNDGESKWRKRVKENREDEEEKDKQNTL